MTAETLHFQAEVNRLLHLVVNSLYTHKEIFLRELVSNASDALDKLSFRALTDHDLMGSEETLEMRIRIDRSSGTLILSDNGIGMTREELVENLGTIARSGSRKFVEALGQSGGEGSEGKEPGLIGQFGVGFYSSFLVADRVEVVSRAAGAEQAYCWSSDAKESFTIEEATREERGTDIRVHMKATEQEFLDELRIRNLVRSYSDFISYPIRMLVHRPAKKPDGTIDEDAPKVEEWEQLNRATALWRRPKSEITEEEYEEFYRHVTHDWEKPLAHVHFQVEGVQSFTGLLYLPSKAPFDLYVGQAHGIRLFARRVFVTDDCKELLPEYLRFVRGLIDSDDLPLNVSRETLQYDRVTSSIRKQVSKRVLGLLGELAGEEGGEKYTTFWETFGSVLKEGVHSDADHKGEITKLLRYRSSAQDGWTSLTQYVDRMKEDQEAIYYVIGNDLEAVRHSPHIEGLVAKGYEVLLMTDPIDEWVVHSLPEVEGKKLASAAQGQIDVPDEEKESEEEDESSTEIEPLLEQFKSVLGDRVADVRPSKRLAGSPVCLIAPEGAPSAHLERLMKMQDKDFQGAKRVFEVNPDHPLIRNLVRHHGTGEGAQEKTGLDDWVLLLYDQALLAEGSPISDPAQFTRRMTEMLTALSESEPKVES